MGKKAGWNPTPKEHITLFYVDGAPTRVRTSREVNLSEVESVLSHFGWRSRSITGRGWSKVNDAWEQDLNAERSDHYMSEVVSGKWAEQRTTDPDTRNPDFDDAFCAVPVHGGYVLERGAYKRIPGTEIEYPVSAALGAVYRAEDRLDERVNWVVVRIDSGHVAMTLKEAYDRGLRESTDWGRASA